MGQNEMIFYIVAAGCMICLMIGIVRKPAYLLVLLLRGAFCADDRIWNQYCLYAERNHSTSQS